MRIDSEINRQGNNDQHHVQSDVKDMRCDVLLPDDTTIDPDLVDRCWMEHGLETVMYLLAKKERPIGLYATGG